MLDGADEVLERHLGGPFAFVFDMSGRFGVGLDRQAVGGKRNFEAVVSVAVRGELRIGIVEEAREAVFAIRDIDGLEEVG